MIISSLRRESQMPATESKPPRIYLDYNASSPMAAGVGRAVADALLLPGNPSSPHAEGRRARALLEDSRLAVAEAIGSEPFDLVFCSGGTEANHLGLHGLAACHRAGSRVLLAPTLHPSLESAGQMLGARGIEVDLLEVDRRGRLDLEALQRELDKRDVKLVAFSLANHETGVIEDAGKIAELTSAAGALTYCDAVQAWGRVPVSVRAMGLDGVSISAHKIGGPKGVGALWLRPGPDVRALIGGGQQENGLRPGTQACSLIAGFAEACRLLPERLESAADQAALRAATEESLVAMGADLVSGEGGLCNTICARFGGVPGDLVVSGLDLEGVAIATGAACSSGTTAASTNLLGMGLSEQQALEAIRISMGPQTRAQELKVLLEKLPTIIERARRFS